MKTTYSQRTDPSPSLRPEPDHDGLAQETFLSQAGRILEHIELLENQCAEDIELAGTEVKSGLRICALSLRGYLEYIGRLDSESDHHAAARGHPAVAD